MSIGAQNVPLFHNLGAGVDTGILLVPPTVETSIQLLFNPWEYIQRGTARQNRIGDKISPRGMALKLFLSNFADHPNVQYRVIVAILPKMVQGSIVSTNFNPFQIPSNFTQGSNLLRYADQDKGVRFLYDRIHTPNASWMAARASGGLTRRPSKTIKLWIRRKKAGPIVFDESTNVIVNRPIAVYVIPYAEFTTLQTTALGTVDALMQLYWKDP